MSSPFLSAFNIRIFLSQAVVSTGLLLQLYTKALSVLGLKEKLNQQKADEALIIGQAFVFNYYQ